MEDKKETTELETAHGTLVVNNSNEEYPKIGIDVKLKGHEQDPAVPVCSIEAPPKDFPGKPHFVVRIYDGKADSFKHRIEIPVEDLESLFGRTDCLQVVCPKCGKASSTEQWNKATASFFGDKMNPIEEEYFAENGWYRGNPKLLYSCPKCDEVSPSKKLRLKR